jgi:hypothetical protein
MGFSPSTPSLVYPLFTPKKGLDRMNRRFAHRVDIAMRKDEVDRALEFGIQRRYVEVKPGRP